MVTITIARNDAVLLALLLKRLTYEDVARRAEDERQRDGMLLAAETVRRKLYNA